MFQFAVYRPTGTVTKRELNLTLKVVKCHRQGRFIETILAYHLLGDKVNVLVPSYRLGLLVLLKNDVMLTLVEHAAHHQLLD